VQKAFDLFKDSSVERPKDKDGLYLQPDGYITKSSLMAVAKELGSPI
jgi:hypothetical protein